ncbi:MAG: aldehyde ferredoxin oxidoreductase family protein [Thermoplasmata archaeon]
MKIPGYANALLYVDLGKKRVRRKRVPPEIVRKYIGGAGFCSYYLFHMLRKGIEPLSPKNVLMFATGPFTGTLWPQGSRYTVACKSPLTDGWGEAHSAGFWGPYLKFAGYDGIIIRGAAKRPVYLVIRDGEVEIKKASHLWGMRVEETEETIRKDEGKEFRVASIGPAGENLVRFAAIMNDLDRAAARCGVGAVMGSKKLKAIAVYGTRPIEIYDKENYLEGIKEFHAKMEKDPLTPGRIKYGTTALVDLMNEIGRFPTYNCRTGYFPEASRINGDAINAGYLIKPRADFACTQRCARYCKVEKGKYRCISGGPEYETLSSLGSRCGNSNLEAVLYANYLCNDLGMDTISAGATISWAMECYELGLIDKRDTQGLDLKWGNHEVICELLEMIAYRKGFGKLLAEGSYRAAQKIGRGTEKYVMHVKKMEIAGQDGRAQKSMGLGMTVSPRGADHLYAFPVLDEAGFVEKIKEVYGEQYLPEIADRLSPKYKGYMVFVNENFSTVVESLGACKYGTMVPPALFYPEVILGLKLTTGIEFTRKELETIGERIVNLNRLFNIREGFSAKDDVLPWRFTNEPMPDGAARGQIVEIEEMLRDYYALRNWDEKGYPRKEKIRELGLEKEWEIVQKSTPAF